jgi:hypothetical protein
VARSKWEVHTSVRRPAVEFNMKRDSRLPSMQILVKLKVKNDDENMICFVKLYRRNKVHIL